MPLADSIRTKPFWFTTNRFFRASILLFLFLSAPFRRCWLYDPSRILVFIVIRDLYSPLDSLIARLKSQGISLSNIYLLDSGSSSPSCLSALTFFDKLGCNLLHLPSNHHIYGPYVPWLSPAISSLIRSTNYPFIVTDPDLELPDSLPHSWLFDLFSCLSTYKFISKASLPLSIDALTSLNSHEIVSHELSLYKSPFYLLLTKFFFNSKELHCPSFCTTDTTFSIYRPFVPLFFTTFSARLDKRFSIVHLPWYTSFTSSAEFRHYQHHKLSCFGDWSSR